MLSAWTDLRPRWRVRIRACHDSRRARGVDPQPRHQTRVGRL